MDVLNRTTKEFIESADTTDYPTESWIHNPDMSPVSGVRELFWHIVGDTVREKTAAEKDADCLAQVRSEKCGEIDLRTQELIFEGFTYDSKTFSLSACAQDNLNGMYETRDENWVTYPIPCNTKDDTDKTSLADAAAVDAFYQAAYNAKRGHLDGGTTLKDQVRAATTVAGVDAVEDMR